MPFIDQPLPYALLLPERPVDEVDLVVMHCTELPDLVIAREYGEKVHYPNGTGHSGHYLRRSRRRRVPLCRSDPRVAHHTRGYNPRSIGIELVNTGRYPDWFDTRRQAMTEPYPDAQIAALVALLGELRQAFPNLREDRRPRGSRCGDGRGKRRSLARSAAQARSRPLLSLG